MKFKIIFHIQSKIVLKKILPFFIIIPAISAYYYTNRYPDKMNLFLPQITFYLFFFISIFLAVYAHFIMKPFRTIGFVKFNKDYIELLGDKIIVDKISTITVLFDSYYGEELSRFSVKQGDKNEIEIVMKGETKHSYYFFLGKKSELNYMKNTMNYYSKRGIKINFIG